LLTYYAFGKHEAYPQQLKHLLVLIRQFQNGGETF